MGFSTVMALEVALSWRSAKDTKEIRRLIRDMSLANRLWGAWHPWRTAHSGDRSTLQSTVAKYMAKSGRERSQSWKTFLHNQAAGIAAMDFLIVPTVGFKLLFVLVILSTNGGG